MQVKYNKGGMMNLKHLYYFNTYAHLMSTTEAAKKLGISSPALSNQLKDLEAFIGSKLTHRIDGKIEITEIGEIVLNYTDQMFGIYETLKTQISVAKEIKNSQFRIGISPDLGARFCFDLISLLVKPNLSFHDRVTVTIDSFDELVSKFKKELYDVVLGAFELSPGDHSTGVSQTFTFPVNLFAPASLKEEFLKRHSNLNSAGLDKMIEFANEMKMPWILPLKPSLLRDETDKLMQASGVVPKKTIECNSSAAIVQLVERGFAMGFIPTPCLLDFKSANLLTLLGPQGGYWTHQISVLAQKQESLPALKSATLDEIFRKF